MSSCAASIICVSVQAQQGTSKAATSRTRTSSMACRARHMGSRQRSLPGAPTRMQLWSEIRMRVAGGAGEAGGTAESLVLCCLDPFICSVVLDQVG